MTAGCDYGDMGAPDKPWLSPFGWASAIVVGVVGGIFCVWAIVLACLLIAGAL